MSGEYSLRPLAAPTSRRRAASASALSSIALIADWIAHAGENQERGRGLDTAALWFGDGGAAAAKVGDEHHEVRITEPVAAQHHWSIVDQRVEKLGIRVETSEQFGEPCVARMVFVDGVGIRGDSAA